MLGGTGNATLSSSGGSSITMFGGTGNDSLSATAGSTITIIGGSGNDTLTATNGSSVSMLGGTGNSTLTSSGGSSITMFGGTGNDSLSSSGGSSVSMIGGSGNDTLSSAADTNAILVGGGAGNASLNSTGGASITMFGGSGSDTLAATGGAAVGMYGLGGNNVYEVSGPISASLNDLATFGDNADASDQAQGVNTILFPGLSTLMPGQRGIHIDLSDTSAGAATTANLAQTVASGITLSLTGQFQNVIGTPGDDYIKGDAASNVLWGGFTGNDTLVGDSGPATLLPGSGSDLLIAGSGGTTFRFDPRYTQGGFGNDTIDPPAGTANTLDFSQLASGATINLGVTTPQNVSTGLNITLQDAAEINALVDTPFADNITGNAVGDTFYLSAGDDTVTGSGGADSFFFAGSQLGSKVINESATGILLNFAGFNGPINLNLNQSNAGVLQTLSQTPASALSLKLSNPSAISTVVGTPYSDTIVGNSDAAIPIAESIFGGGGNDSLVAGSGNDLVQGNINQVVCVQFNVVAGDIVYTSAEITAIMQGLAQDYAPFNYFFTTDLATAQAEARPTGGQFVTLQINEGAAGGASTELNPGNIDLGGISLININPFLGDPAAGLVPVTDANIIGLTTTIAAHELGHLSGLQHQDSFGPIGTGIYAGVNASEFGPTYTGPSGATETPNDIMASPASVGTTLAAAAGHTYFGERDSIKLAFNDSGTTLQQANLTPTTPELPVLDPSHLLPVGTPNFSIANAYSVGTLPTLAVPNTLLSGARDYGKTFDVAAVAVNATLSVPQDFYAINGQAGQIMTFAVISNNNTLNFNPILPELVLIGPDGQVIAYNAHEFESADSALLDVTLPKDGTYYVGVDSLQNRGGNYQLFMYSFATNSNAPLATGDTIVGGSGNDTLVASSGNDQIVFPTETTGTATVQPGSGQLLLDLSKAPGETVTVATIPGQLNNLTTINAFAAPSLAVTGLSPGQTFVYDGQTHGATGATSDIVGLNLSLAYYRGDSATGTPLSGAPSAAGTYTVVAMFAGDATHNSATSAPVTFTINPAAITVTIGNDSHAYGSTANLSSYFGATGVNGETLGIVYSSTGNTATAHAGGYAITGAVSDGSGLASNYAVTFIDGTLTVNPAAIAYVIADDRQTYGSPANLTADLAATFSTGVNGQTLAIAYSSTGDTATANVGTYAISGVAANGTGLASDYTVTLTNGTLTVDPVELSDTIGDVVQTYGTPAIFTGATLAGVNGEMLNITYSSSGDTTDAHVGSYDITGLVSDGTGLASNYTVTLTRGTLTVNPAPIVYTIANSAQTYGTAANFAAILGTTISGVNGETLDIAYSSAGDNSTAHVVTGGYTITGTLTNSTGLTSDYSVTLNNGTLTVNPYSLTYQIVNDSQAYGTAATLTADLPGTISTGVNGENLALNYSSTGDTAAAHAGSYAITGTPANSTGLASDYNLTLVSGTLTVNPYAMTYQIGNASQTYGTAVSFAHALGTTIAGVNGETLNITYASNGATNAAHVGSYDITGTLADGTGMASDYDVTLKNGSLTVNPYAFTYQIGSDTQTYGTAANLATDLGTKISGINGQTLNIAYSSAGNAVTAHVGSYAITGQVSDDTGLASDYAVTLADGTLIVNPATLTVTAAAVAKVYGAANPTFTAAFAGFVNGDDESVLHGSADLSTSVTAASPVGTYTNALVAAQGTLSAADYMFTFAPGTLTVTPATPTVTVVADSGVYTGSPFIATATVVGVGGATSDQGVTPAVTLAATLDYIRFNADHTSTDLGANAPTGASSYEVIATFAGSADYSSASAATTFTISPANAPTVTVSDGGVYDGKAHVATAAVNGAATLDGVPLTVTYYVTATGAPLAGAPQDAGTYTVVATYAGDANYPSATATATFAIDPYAFRYTIGDDRQTYGTPANLTADLPPTIATGINGETLAIACSSTGDTATAHVQSGGYAITGMLSDGTGKATDYAVTLTNGTLTINPYAFTYQIVDDSQTYGTAANLASDLGGTIATGVNGETLAIAYSSAGDITTADVLAGGYAITGTLSNGSGKASDYTVALTNGALTVNPYAFTYQIVNDIQIYGTAANLANDLGNTIDTGVNGENLAITYSSAGDTTTAHVQAGGYAITGTLSNGSGVTSDYAVTLKNGTLTVNPYAFSFTIGNDSQTYGTAANLTNDLPATLNTGVNGQNLAIAYSSTGDTTTAHVQSGGYAITGMLSNGSGVTSDYNVTLTSGTLTVNPYAFSCTIGNDSQTYGSPANLAHDLGTTISTGVNGETLAIGYSSAGDTATAAVGAYPITGTLSNASGVTTDYNVTLNNGTLTVLNPVVPSAAVYVLSKTASGALTLSGNANINVPGVIEVDSSSASAISGSGNAIVTATGIQVVGGASLTGSAKFNPNPTTHAAYVADPLFGLAIPSVSGSSQGPLNVSGKITINPGIYSSISVSGNGNLTMNPGIYVIAGGGFSVSGNGIVNGTGVLIYNAGSSYPNAGGNFAGITLSANAQVNLTAPTAGVYAGLAIFQSRDNAQPLNLSGNNASSIQGSVYAPAAALTMSGNAKLKDALIVNTLTLSGNAIFNNVPLDTPTGAVAYGPAQVRDAYGINQLSLDGTGQVIAIVDAYDNPAIYASLDQFDAQFSATTGGATLYSQYGPASTFLTVMNQDGQLVNLPATDPNGAGAANWEGEEALDVEWIHAIAPGARIILVEANSQSLGDLMTGVATAAGQANVSVVSMSWGFTEGQDVFAADEAAYDSYFTTPGVTFVASTGDYGAANPEFPAMSPNVLAVGGTSLSVNADNSYKNETGWGAFDNASGTLIASGGGISQFEAEPAYQQAMQSTGYRTTPDVAFVADPNTGAWIADPYNLAGDNPFEVVGGTSLSAPSWAGLVALADQGRQAAGQATLNTGSPTDTQHALYGLPQTDYNVIASGNNGYSAGPGYNLVTGLGTPQPNLLVPDLIAWQGSSDGNVTVAPIQPANLVYHGGAVGGGSGAAFQPFSLEIAGAGRLAYPSAPSAPARSSASDQLPLETVVQNAPAADLPTTGATPPSATSSVVNRDQTITFAGATGSVGINVFGSAAVLAVADGDVAREQPAALAAESLSLHVGRAPTRAASGIIGLEFLTAKDSSAWTGDAHQIEASSDNGTLRFPISAAANDAAVRIQLWEREGASAAAVGAVGLPQFMTLASDDVGAPIGIADRAPAGEAAFLPVAIAAGEERSIDGRMGRRGFLRWLWFVPALLQSLTRRKGDKPAHPGER
jgi:hypothetical protein